MLYYIGKGDYLPGIPARDLTAEEVKLYGLQFLLKTGLYAETKEQKPDYEDKLQKPSPDSENKRRTK